MFFCHPNLSGFCTNLRSESPQAQCCRAFLQAKTGPGMFYRCHSQPFHPERRPQTLQQASPRVPASRSGQESLLPCPPERSMSKIRAREFGTMTSSLLSLGTRTYRVSPGPTSEGLKVMRLTARGALMAFNVFSLCDGGGYMKPQFQFQNHLFPLFNVGIYF